MQEFNDSTPTDVVRLPMVPIRDVVVFPHTMARFVIGRPASVHALEAALAGDRLIFLATQHDATIDEPTPDQVFEVGTIARISHSLRLQDGNIKVMVDGTGRGRTVRVDTDPAAGSWSATVRLAVASTEPKANFNAILGRLGSLVDQYVRQASDLQNPESLQAALRMEEPERIADTIASNLKISVDEKQSLLEVYPVRDRLVRLIDLIEVELDKLQVDRSIQGRVKRQMEKAQKEYYLNEKIKAIHKELGRKDEKAELDELRSKIENAGMSEDALAKAMTELKRLEQMPSMSAESTVSRNYLDWLLAVPWKERSEETRDIRIAEEVLNNDHYGLDKVKERILEYLAVRQLVTNPKGSILCFVGPPGVGKTSLGRSIAKATGRKFVRLSLGGVRDEAEIRGHRRTYIGAIPGQIIQMMRKAGTVNPLMLLDEVDKLGMDFRGDPSSALLEVLDPEQNHSFHDHYLDVEYDLSNVMFIATANVLHSIPPPLQDRLEIIRLPGYTEREKLEIANRHLVPKQLEQSGLKPDQVEYTSDAVKMIIEYYTREAGVRSLEREIASTLRKIARQVVSSEEPESYKVTVTGDAVKEYLGPTRFRPQMIGATNEIGLSNGLAWTEVGGEVLQIEATLMPGRGKISITGKLGDVMQESAQAAMTFVRSRAIAFDLASDFYRNFDFHLHVPEGAIPKDGPSAGVAMATAIVSALTRTAVRRDVAMTGEITLRGKVLPVGGIKEKLLAAHRAGIPTVILPKDNEKDLVELPDDVRSAMQIHLIETTDEALQIALVEYPVQEDSFAKVPLWTARRPDVQPEGRAE
ncbi:MAG: endopeptidase La [Blastocatellia bacterium]|jgi:ATP-dependent Lon protease|nr:endopeptidase La [Blastocatellia bacterium]